MLEIEANLDGGWEAIGAMIRKAGLEDGSGIRGAVARMLVKREYEPLQRLLNVSVVQCEAYRNTMIVIWGERPDLL